MPSTLRFQIDLPSGLHARPASMIADTVRRFHAAATVTNVATGEAAEARSVLSLIGLDVQYGHAVVLDATGDDESELIDAVRVLVHERFGEQVGRQESHAAGVDVSGAGGDGLTVAIPAGIARASLMVIPGRAISRGPWGTPWAGGTVGAVVTVGELSLSEEDLACRTAAPSVERAHFQRAVRTVRAALEARRASSAGGVGGGAAYEIVRAHLSILDDPVLTARVLELIDAGAPVPCAIIGAGRTFAAKLRASSSRYIRERVGDVDEVCRELVRGVDPALCPSGVPKLSGPSVIFASSLGVNDLLGLEREHAVGLVVGTVGETSHVAILARALQIPTIACENDPVALIKAFGGGNAKRAMVDAVGGYALLDPSESVAAYAQRERTARATLGMRSEPIVNEIGKTRDGRAMEVAANTATASESVDAMRRGADGVGLFRTEILFLDRPHPPSEDEQYKEYVATAEAAAAAVQSASSLTQGPARGGVIFRTFDIGADKPAPYLNLRAEENPFLGVRGVRLYALASELIRGQVRAICRASATARRGGKGGVRIMAPMIATLGEARGFVALVRDVQRELAAAGIDHDPKMSIGVMVEVPALAAIVGRLAGVVDFVSIGTNDLAQYLFAADRTSAAVSGLNNPRQPALLSVLERTIREARDAGIWVGVCGEMAADPQNLPLLVGMGPDEISVNPGAVAELKTQLRRLESTRCRAMLLRAAQAESVNEVDELLRTMPTELTGEDPLTPEMVLLDRTLDGKREVIHALACAAAAAGRAANPRQLETDIWNREKTYSTGVGFGVAIPHARSASVQAPTIGVCRLASPVRWTDGAAADDDDGVKLAVLLCVPADSAGGEAKMDAVHQRMLATLARKLMHEEFRDAIHAARTEDDVIHLLRTNLTLTTT